MINIQRSIKKAKAAGNKAAMQTAHDKVVALRINSGEYEFVQRTNYSTGKTTSTHTGHGGAREDWVSTALAVPVVAVGVYYAPVIAPTALAATDVATMGYSATTMAGGATVIVTGAKVVNMIPELNQIAQKSKSVNRSITGVIRSDGTIEAYLQDAGYSLTHKSLGLTKADLGFNLGNFEGKWFLTGSGYSSQMNWAQPTPAQQIKVLK